MSLIHSNQLRLRVLDSLFAVCRFEAQEEIPLWVNQGEFHSITRSKNELSVVCEQKSVPTGIKAERDWNALQVDGVLDFGLTGILSSIATPLADEKISIFAISTFDTDYILVRSAQLQHAMQTLRNAGFQFV